MCSLQCDLANSYVRQQDHSKSMLIIRRMNHCSHRVYTYLYFLYLWEEAVIETNGRMSAILNAICIKS